jgi:hypothetical protein
MSSDNFNFNQPIRDLKDADRTMKIEHNQIPYTFLVSTERKMMMFRKRWQAFIQGTEQPQEQEKPEDVKDEGENQKPPDTDQKEEPKEK